MIQPSGILTMYESLNDQSINGWFHNHKPDYFALLANRTYLLPFQIKRVVSGAAITVFKLVGQGTEIDLISDVAKITTYDYVTYEWLVFTGLETLTTSLPTYGYYYLVVSDGTGTYYSDYMKLGSFTVSDYSFGSYTPYYTNSYQITGSTTGYESNYYDIFFSSPYDLTDKIYQNGYFDRLIMNKKDVSLRYLGRNEQTEIDESTGKELINQIFSYDEYELNFLINRNSANFINKIKQLTKLTIILPNSEVIESFDFDPEITALETDQAKKVTLKYRTNYINKSDTTYNDVKS